MSNVRFKSSTCFDNNAVVFDLNTELKLVVNQIITCEALFMKNWDSGDSDGDGDGKKLTVLAIDWL